MSEAAVSVRRDGAILRLSGALDRAAATSLWRQVQATLDGVTTIDLQDVTRIDSAGLALLVALVERAGNIAVVGTPHGIDELRAAYRLTPVLSF